MEMEYLELTESDTRIYNLVPYGQGNAVSREYLTNMTGFSDRRVRRSIERLRVAGLLICSSSSFNGYWKPTKRAEVQQFIDEMDSRAKMCFTSIKAARNYMKIHEDQLMLSEVQTSAGNK